MSSMGQYTVLQAAIPGVASENIGVLLVDDSGAAHLKFRRDLHTFVNDEDDVEYLQFLEDDLRGKASEMGGEWLLRWMTNSWSNVIRMSDPEETAVAWAESDIRRLYKAHVTPKVLPFQTHLPMYTLAAAAGSWGEQMEVTEERLGGSATGPQADRRHVRSARGRPLDGAEDPGGQPVRFPSQCDRLTSGPPCTRRKLRAEG